MSGLLALLAVAVTTGVVTSGSRLRRQIGFAIGALGLLIPWVFPVESPGFRGVMALGSAWLFARALDLFRDHRPWSALQRVIFACVIFDSREAQATRARFRADACVALLAYAAFGAAGLFLATEVADQFAGPIRLGLRWLGGLAFVYSTPDIASAALRLTYGAIGVQVPEMHRRPILSTSLAEFWGVRWNRMVSAWLRRNFFLPWARRRQPAVGLACAFGASTILHMWFAGVAVGWWGAISMGSYFVIQGALVLLERRFAPTGLSGRAWAVLGTGLPAPLFVEPVVQMFEPLLRDPAAFAGFV